MNTWLTTQIGAQAADIVSYVILFIASIISLWLLIVVVRHFGRGTFFRRSFTKSTLVTKDENHKTRLFVRNTALVDENRRLILISRDNVEHLILIGGPTDLVIESNITSDTPGWDTAAQSFTFEDKKIDLQANENQSNIPINQITSNDANILDKSNFSIQDDKIDTKLSSAPQLTKDVNHEDQNDTANLNQTSSPIQSETFNLFVDDKDNFHSTNFDTKDQGKDFTQIGDANHSDHLTINNIEKKSFNTPLQSSTLRTNQEPQNSFMTAESSSVNEDTNASYRYNDGVTTPPTGEAAHNFINNINNDERQNNKQFEKHAFTDNKPNFTQKLSPIQSETYSSLADDQDKFFSTNFDTKDQSKDFTKIGDADHSDHLTINNIEKKSFNTPLQSSTLRTNQGPQNSFMTAKSSFANEDTNASYRYNDGVTTPSTTEIAHNFINNINNDERQNNKQFEKHAFTNNKPNFTQKLSPIKSETYNSLADDLDNFFSTNFDTKDQSKDFATIGNASHDDRLTNNNPDKQHFNTPLQHSTLKTNLESQNSFITAKNLSTNNDKNALHHYSNAMAQPSTTETARNFIKSINNERQKTDLNQKPSPIKNETYGSFTDDINNKKSNNPDIKNQDEHFTKIREVSHSDHIANNDMRNSNFDELLQPPPLKTNKEPKSSFTTEQNTSASDDKNASYRYSGAMAQPSTTETARNFIQSINDESKKNDQNSSVFANEAYNSLADDLDNFFSNHSDIKDQNKDFIKTREVSHSSHIANNDMKKNDFDELLQSPSKEPQSFSTAAKYTPTSDDKNTSSYRYDNAMAQPSTTETAHNVAKNINDTNQINKINAQPLEAKTFKKDAVFENTIQIDQIKSPLDNKGATTIHDSPTITNTENTTSKLANNLFGRSKPINPYQVTQKTESLRENDIVLGASAANLSMPKNDIDNSNSTTFNDSATKINTITRTDAINNQTTPPLKATAMVTSSNVPPNTTLAINSTASYIKIQNNNSGSTAFSKTVNENFDSLFLKDNPQTNKNINASNSQLVSERTITPQEHTPTLKSTLHTPLNTTASQENRQNVNKLEINSSTSHVSSEGNNNSDHDTSSKIVYKTLDNLSSKDNPQANKNMNASNSQLISERTITPQEQTTAETTTSKSTSPLPINTETHNFTSSMKDNSKILQNDILNKSKDIEKYLKNTNKTIIDALENTQELQPAVNLANINLSSSGISKFTKNNTANYNETVMFQNQRVNDTNQSIDGTANNKTENLQKFSLQLLDPQHILDNPYRSPINNKETKSFDTDRTDTQDKKDTTSKSNK